MSLAWLTVLVLAVSLIVGAVLVLPFWSYDKGWLREPSTLFGLIVLLVVVGGLLLPHG
jgi:hypothetical protein